MRDSAIAKPAVFAAPVWSQQRLRAIARMAPAFLLFVWLCAEGFATAAGPDEATYKIIDVGIVHGQWPYRDLFINRQPLTFLWYLPMGLGASIDAERVFAAAMMAASVPMVMRMAARWLSPERALPAGIIYALLLANPFLTVRANTEAFLLLPLTASFVVGSPFFAGALLGAAVMTKLHAALFAPVLLVLWKRRLPPVVLGGAAVVALCSVPFIPIWRDFWDANVTFAFDYGRYTAGNRMEALKSVDWALVYATLPLWIAGAIGLLRSRSLALILLTLAGVASVKASGFDYPHYYALLMPPLAILAAEGLAFMRRHRALRLTIVACSWWALLVSALAVVAIFALRGPRGYGVLGARVSDTSGEVFVLGSRSDLYVYAGRQPDRRFFFSTPYVIAPHWSDGVRDDLLRCPPDVLVVVAQDPWPVPWRSDVTALYATDETYEDGTIYTNPARTCTRYQP